jgi:hypothetical protein
MHARKMLWQASGASESRILMRVALGAAPFKIAHTKFREHPSLLKNSFMPFSDPYSDVKSAAFGLFELG